MSGTRIIASATRVSRLVNAKRGANNPRDQKELRAVILAVSRYFESKGQPSNRSLQYFQVLHSSVWPARMRFRDQFVLQATLYAQRSETSGCQALLICQRPRLSPPSPVASGWCRDSCVTIHSATSGLTPLVLAAPSTNARILSRPCGLEVNFNPARDE